MLPYSCSVRITPSPSARRFFQPRGYCAYTGLSNPGTCLPPCVPTVLSWNSTGISTCCPSATLPSLALGPDLPRADQLYPGNLRYPAGRIPTFLSLLIPAFSLRCSPRPLSVPLPPAPDAPLPAAYWRLLSFGSVFQPRTFSAQDLSTSELLRTL